uniref:Uncharacterized protein n=1 Tax=Parascaris univalens TaxID=6257 RepID=A0A914ZGL8_PARUN
MPLNKVACSVLAAVVLVSVSFFADDIERRMMTTKGKPTHETRQVQKHERRREQRNLGGVKREEGLHHTSALPVVAKRHRGEKQTARLYPTAAGHRSNTKEPLTVDGFGGTHTTHCTSARVKLKMKGTDGRLLTMFANSVPRLRGLRGNAQLLANRGSIEQTIHFGKRYLLCEERWGRQTLKYQIGSSRFHQCKQYSLEARGRRMIRALTPCARFGEPK